MAACTVTGRSVVCNSPFLVRKITITGGTDLAITHGEDRKPDLILSHFETAGAVPAQLSVVQTSATVINVATLAAVYHTFF